MTTDLKLSIASLLNEIYYYDSQRNTEAIERRKEVHRLLVKNRVSYWDAYLLMRELVPGDDFFAVMGRIRETCLSHPDHAMKMVDRYYTSL